LSVGSSSETQQSRTLGRILSFHNFGGYPGHHTGAARCETPEKIEESKGKPGAYLPFIYCFVAELVMAWVLAGLMAHLGAGQVTLLNGIISGAFCWLGFVITTLVVSNTFAKRDTRLIWIDGGHWLIVLVLMGAIIGLMGV